MVCREPPTTHYLPLSTGGRGSVAQSLTSTKKFLDMGRQAHETGIVENRGLRVRAVTDTDRLRQVRVGPERAIAGRATDDPLTSATPMGEAHLVDLARAPTACIDRPITRSPLATPARTRRASLPVLTDRRRTTVADLASQLTRFGAYRPGCPSPLDRTLAGDASLVTESMDSYHAVWFQLPEDLLATTGISREEQRQRKREIIASVRSASSRERDGSGEAQLARATRSSTRPVSTLMPGPMVEATLTCRI